MTELLRTRPDTWQESAEEQLRQRVKALEKALLQCSTTMSIAANAVEAAENCLAAQRERIKMLESQLAQSKAPTG
jgi:chromosome segregation ATPase